MALPKADLRMTAAEFLEWEQTQLDKHEFVDGLVYSVFAMAGAHRDHVTVAGNVFALLKDRLRGGPCRAYISDMKVWLQHANTYFYPDVVVTCDPRDHAAERHVQHPSLVVEVLSESTAAYDRGDKFALYRQLESLREYVLVDPFSRAVDCFRRDASGHWVLYDFRASDQIELQSVGVSLLAEAIFENTEPPVAPGLGVNVTPR